MARPSVLMHMSCWMAAVGTPASAQQPIDCGRMASVEQVDLALTKRAVDIVRIAQAGDATKLSDLVAPRAEFVLIDHDVILPSTDGPAGAVKFAQTLQPRSFDFAIAGSGPSLAQMCGKHIETVRFTTQSGTAYAVEFSFDRGLLIRATGRLATVFTGGMGASGG